MYPRLIAIENNPYVLNGIYIYNFAISTVGLPKGSIVHGYMTIYYGVLFQASGNIMENLGPKGGIQNRMVQVTLRMSRKSDQMKTNAKPLCPVGKPPVVWHKGKEGMPHTSGLHQFWCNIYSADVYEILGRQLGHSNSFLQNKAVKVEAPRWQPHNQPKKCSRAKYMEWMVMTYAISGTDFSASPAIDAPKKSIRNWASSLGEARRHHIAGARGWVWTPNRSHDCWVQ